MLQGKKKRVGIFSPLLNLCKGGTKFKISQLKIIFNVLNIIKYFKL